MTIAFLAVFGAFVGVLLIGSIVTAVLANLHQLFALLFHVPPYRTVTTMALAFAATWAGLSAFEALA